LVYNVIAYDHYYFLVWKHKLCTVTQVFAVGSMKDSVVVEKKAFEESACDAVLS